MITVAGSPLARGDPKMMTDPFERFPCNECNGSGLEFLGYTWTEMYDTCHKCCGTGHYSNLREDVAALNFQKSCQCVANQAPAH